MSSSFFQNAHHFVSNADTLISAQSYHVHNGGASGSGNAFQLLQENISEGAMHNSDERCDPPMCHPETRKAVQEDVFSWITHGDGEAEPKKILWMSGPAGCGKTAIAGTVAEECEERGLLAGSFFCSSFSGSQKRRSKRFVIPTLAYQLMQNDGTGVVRMAILSSIERDPTVFRKRLKDQCRVLLLQPFQNLHAQGSPHITQQIIIIDGLDEIESSDSRQLDRQKALQENEADQVEVLSALLQAIHHPAFPFRIFIFSRPERGIREFFAAQPAKGITLELFLDDEYEPDDDIELFLRSKFADIRRRYHLPSSWPTEDVIRELVGKASGQFIYAATVVRFLQDGSDTPAYQLDCILRLKYGEATSGDPFATLDSLYTHILNSSPNPTLAAEWILSLHTGTAWLGDSPALYCRQLLERRPGEAEHLLGGLSSLIHTPTSDEEPLERGRKAFPGLGDPERLLRHSFLRVLKDKMPFLPLPQPELEIFLSEFLSGATDGWIELVMDGFGDYSEVNAILAQCDVAWWLYAITTTDDAVEIICEIFKHVHNDCLFVPECTPGCLNWRGGILEFCRSRGWTIPGQQHFLAEKEWNDRNDDGYYEFDHYLRPPGRSVAHLLCEEDGEDEDEEGEEGDEGEEDSEDEIDTEEV